MKPEAQRKAIAEACPTLFRLTATGNNVVLWRHNEHVVDPLNDLNAMHEAEKSLSEQDKWNYGNTLALMVLAPERAYFNDPEGEPNLNGFGHFSLATLTAAQRAEAFLKTLGIWVEETT